MDQRPTYRSRRPVLMVIVGAMVWVAIAGTAYLLTRLVAG